MSQSQPQEVTTCTTISGKTDYIMHLDSKYTSLFEWFMVVCLHWRFVYIGTYFETLLKVLV